MSSIRALEDERCIQQTMCWIKSFIIELNICPFAKREMDKKSVRAHVSRAETLEARLHDLMAEIELLNTNTEIETSLLLFPTGLGDFFDYLDFVDVAEALLFTNGYEGVYQLATFHPEYCFAGVDVDDVANYTNRAPYPMLHLLREERLDEAIAYYGDTEQIPENNIKCLRDLGLDKVRQLLNQSMS